MTLTGSDSLWLVALACALAVAASAAAAVLYAQRARRLKAQLSQCRANLRRAATRVALSEEIPAMLAYIDRGLNNFYHTRHYREWLGLRREEVEGRPIREILGEEAKLAEESHSPNLKPGDIVAVPDHPPRIHFVEPNPKFRFVVFHK